MFPKKLQHWVATSLIAWWSVLLLLVAVYVAFAICRHDISFLGRGAGVASFIGLLMTTVASIRVDHGITSSKLTDDPFFCHGFVISAIGVLFWAVL